MDQQFWEDKYREQDQLWSGAPNGVLVVEAADLAPGRALDLGCGEGGDAIWLAERGWLVTAVDISRVALDRAAVLGASVAGKVTWTHADLTVTAPPAGTFDLVAALYFPIPHQPEHTALLRLLAAVASGGTLLVGGHDLDGHQHHHDAAFDASQYYVPAEIAELLDDSWTVVTNETRPRTSPAPPGSGHIDDVVLRAVRRP
ncbi:MAG: methyltransferase domain-containing protein [Actinophytocola sp.]|uniref:class I SAM-dependent methyltransferase n=1 Tax=Actinophytocola sp. TaxID=1872138 RepID=UPI0013236DAE|nr:class I SAM-dependent methyltransferase [Actinophytocola sp.]MPZ82566.1 methyltransferase domain-containing protein [Actinophytocola sp.]